MRLVACIRVSRVAGRGGESFISPDVQREQIEAYAKARRHEIVAWREDLDRPGSTLDRPGMQEALALVGSGEADGIIAAKLDRITRSLADLGHLLKRARDERWNLIAVDVGLDLGTPNGRLVAHVLGSVAEWELDRRRADWDQARAHAVARGVHVASRTPTGYRRREDGRLEPDPAAAPVVRELFARRIAGHGWAALTDYLDASGISSPYGSSTWTSGAAQKLIRNRVYLGEARSGRHVNADAHEALVSRGEWEAAQQARAIAPRRRRDQALLAGVVRCGSCRYLMKTDTMRDGRGEQLTMYRCRRRHAAGICPAPATMLTRVLDPQVEQWFLDDLRRRAVRAEAHATTAALDEALAELAEAEDELGRYVESETLTITGRDMYERGLRARAERVDAARARVRDAQRSVDVTGALTPGDLIDAWPTLTVAEKHRFLAAALDAVVVWPQRSSRLSGERVRIVELGDAPPGIPRRGVRVEMLGWDERPGDLGVPLAEDP